MAVTIITPIAIRFLRFCWLRTYSAISNSSSLNLFIWARIITKTVKEIFAKKSVRNLTVDFLIA